MDSSQCSQPIGELVDEIEQIKNNLQYEVKKLKKAKTHDSKYQQCHQSINQLLKELGEINMTVGNLRVTKVGKLMTKYEKDLPPDLAMVAKKLNENWKRVLLSYRQAFKEQINLRKKKQISLLGVVIKEEPLSQVPLDEHEEKITERISPAEPSFMGNLNFTRLKNLASLQPQKHCNQYIQRSSNLTVALDGTNDQDISSNLARPAASSTDATINSRPTISINRVKLKPSPENNGLKFFNPLKAVKEMSNSCTLTNIHEKLDINSNGSVLSTTANKHIEYAKTFSETFIQDVRCCVKCTVEKVEIVEAECLNMRKSMKEISKRLDEYEKNMSTLISLAASDRDNNNLFISTDLCNSKGQTSNNLKLNNSSVVETMKNVLSGISICGKYVTGSKTSVKIPQKELLITEEVNVNDINSRHLNIEAPQNIDDSSTDSNESVSLLNDVIENNVDDNVNTQRYINCDVNTPNKSFPIMQAISNTEAQLNRNHDTQGIMNPSAARCIDYRILNMKNIVQTTVPHSIAVAATSNITSKKDDEEMKKKTVQDDNSVTGNSLSQFTRDSSEFDEKLVSVIMKGPFKNIPVQKKVCKNELPHGSSSNNAELLTVANSNGTKFHCPNSSVTHPESGASSISDNALLFEIEGADDNHIECSEYAVFGSDNEEDTEIGEHNGNICGNNLYFNISGSIPNNEIVLKQKEMKRKRSDEPNIGAASKVAKSSSASVTPPANLGRKYIPNLHSELCTSRKNITNQFATKSPSGTHSTVSLQNAQCNQLSPAHIGKPSSNQSSKIVYRNSVDDDGFKIPMVLSQTVLKTPGNVSIIVKGEAVSQDIAGVDLDEVELESFLSYSQAVDDMDEEIEDNEREYLLDNKQKNRRYWNTFCKSKEGVKYATLLKSNGRMKAAHKSSVGKEGIQTLLNKRSKGTLQRSFSDGQSSQIP